MSIKTILLLISIVLFVCPIGGALIFYRDNLQALVMPENLEFMTNAPEIEYINYSITYNLITLQFRFKNPYNIALNISSIEGDVYCTEHDFCLGAVHEQDMVVVPSNSTAIITLVLSFNSEAPSHFLTQHFGDTHVKIELRNVKLTVQGVEIHYKKAVSIGNIPIPTVMP